jgi:hypothetical protein
MAKNPAKDSAVAKSKWLPKWKPFAFVTSSGFKPETF